jgi:sulfide:quinone oxidoreductase
MQPRKLSNDVSVGPAMETSDFAAAKEHGFASIINNRSVTDKNLTITPDDEARLSAENGLEYRHIPMTSGTLSIAASREFAQALKEMPKPILAHCAGATRSATLWALAQAANGMDIDEIIKVTTDAGFDLSAHGPLMRGLKEDAEKGRG